MRGHTLEDLEGWMAACEEVYTYPCILCYLLCKGGKQHLVSKLNAATAVGCQDGYLWSTE